MTPALLHRHKVACLRDLPGASSKLQLFEADLLEEGSFDACVSGATHIFHTASPFVTSNISNPHEELHKPALEGTRHVFGSIARAMGAGGPPPRVVLTSSVAAIMGKPTDKATCFDEDDWNTSSEAEGAWPSSSLRRPHQTWRRVVITNADRPTGAGSPPGDGLDMYRYSKLIAEREAWALAEKHQLQVASRGEPK